MADMATKMTTDVRTTDGDGELQTIPRRGWYADPTGRFADRWWDGQTWTEHVRNDDGEESFDSVQARLDALRRAREQSGTEQPTADALAEQAQTLIQPDAVDTAAARLQSVRDQADRAAQARAAMIAARGSDEATGRQLSPDQGPADDDAADATAGQSTGPEDIASEPVFDETAVEDHTPDDDVDLMMVADDPSTSADLSESIELEGEPTEHDSPEHTVTAQDTVQNDVDDVAAPMVTDMADMPPEVLAYEWIRVLDEDEDEPTGIPASSAAQPTELPSELPQDAQASPIDRPTEEQTPTPPRASHENLTVGAEDSDQRLVPLSIVLPVLAGVAVIAAVATSVLFTATESAPEPPDIPVAGECRGAEAQGRDLQVGTFDLYDAPTVNCFAPHVAEVVAVIGMQGDARPSDREFEQTATDECIPAAADQLGVAATDLPVTVQAIWPSGDSWDAGRREILCYVTRPDAGPLAGSIIDDSFELDATW